MAFILFRVVSLAAAATYLVLVLIYTLPKNRLSDELRPVTLVVVKRFFHQRWSMFAPNPSTRQREIFVQCEGSGMTQPAQNISKLLRGSGRWSPGNTRLALLLEEILGKELNLRERTTKQSNASKYPSPETQHADLKEHWKRIGTVACLELSNQPTERITLTYTDRQLGQRYADESPMPIQHELTVFEAHPRVAVHGIFARQEP